MNGIKMNELYELISHCHEAEFEYHGITYILQPEVNKGKAYLVIWDCTPDSEKCIAKHEISAEGDISRGVIDAVFSDRCFAGKTFLENEQDVSITVIY